MELFIVHDAGVLRHPSDAAILAQVRAVQAEPNRIISDAAAQTIASWWHSPDSPLSTVLSTMGKVDVRMTRETFASDAELAEVDETERNALDALMAYIQHHISGAGSDCRPCAACCCMELTVGTVGAICSQCEETGCEAGEHCGCEGSPELEDCD